MCFPKSAQSVCIANTFNKSIRHYTNLTIVLQLMHVFNFQPHRTLWRECGERHFSKSHGPWTAKKGSKCMPFGV